MRKSSNNQNTTLSSLKSFIHMSGFINVLHWFTRCNLLHQLSSIYLIHPYEYVKYSLSVYLLAVNIAFTSTYPRALRENLSIKYQHQQVDRPKQINKH